MNIAERRYSASVSQTRKILRELLVASSEPEASKDPQRLFLAQEEARKLLAKAQLKEDADYGPV